MEVNLTVLEAIMLWAAAAVGFLIGWFVGAAMTGAKVEDLEREILKRELMLHEGKR